MRGQAGRMKGLRSFSVRHRIRKKADFAALREHGVRIHCGAFIVQALRRSASEIEGRRIGIITSRRVGNAVHRNRARRLMREIFRNHQESIPEATDLVVIVRNTIWQETYASLEARFLKACARLQRLAPQSEERAGS